MVQVSSWSMIGFKVYDLWKRPTCFFFKIGQFIILFIDGESSGESSAQSGGESSAQSSGESSAQSNISERELKRFSELCSE